MCIIFYNERGVEYNEQEIRRAWRTNQDGVGAMWAENGEVQVIRELLGEDDSVRLAQYLAGTPHVLHFRYGTHGGVSEDLVHPFRASPEGAPDVYLMHNGVMDEREAGGRCLPGESDTQVFARSMMRIAERRGTDIFFDSDFIDYIERRIDPYNKVIFLGADGNIGIVHPKSWFPDEETGIWYSNRYSVTVPRWAPYRMMKEVEQVSPRWAAIYAASAEEEDKE